MGIRRTGRRTLRRVWRKKAKKSSEGSFMSDSQIGGWLIVLLVIAYAIYRYMKERNENAETEQVRALLRFRIDKYTEEGKFYAAKDHYFSSAVEDDTAHGSPPEETDINRHRAL